MSLDANHVIPVIGDLGVDDAKDRSRDEDAVVRILRRVLALLDASGCSYALIHSDKDLAAGLSSDVDIAFDRHPSAIMIPLLARICAEENARLVQCLHYEIPHGYYYILAIGSTARRFLHLDCLYDPVGLNRYHLPTTYLLEGATHEHGARRTRRDRACVYLAMKRALKGRVSSAELQALRNAFADVARVSWNDMRQWFGDEARELIAEVLDAKTPAGADRALSRLGRSADALFRRRFPARYAWAFLLTRARQLRRFVRPTGLFVVFIGPDGAGKSTVADAVAGRLARGFRRVWRFHWRPGVLPKLSRGAAPRSDGDVGVDQAPPSTSRYVGFVSLARFVYYWLDFVVGYWIAIHPRKVRSTLVVGERYFPDVIVHPERYGFAVPRVLVRLAAAFVPSPDLVILLSDRPSLIHARKPELPLDVLAAQLTAYEIEMTNWGTGAIIDGQLGLEQAANRACELVIEACARRTTLRFPARSPAGWHAFPTRRQPKLWIAAGDAVRNGLELYHPYSRSGRALKALLTAMPERAARACLPSVDGFTDATLRTLDAAIAEELDKAEAAISYATGTPGPHRKMTAQLTIDGRIEAYIKIADSASTSTLIQREAEALESLHAARFDAGVVPRALARTRLARHDLLMCSAPPRRTHEKGIALDAADGRFLVALASHSGEELSAATWFERAGYEVIVDELREIDRTAAEAMDAARSAIVAVLDGAPVRLGPSHGDFAPWNTLALEGGGLYVYDWEYASRDAPVLTDLLHRAFMPSRLVGQEPPAVAAGRLLALSNDAIGRTVAEAAGIDTVTFPAYVLLYLVTVALREHRATRRPSEFVIRTLRETLVRLPGARACPRVLVIAYACEPGGGSEPGVGWNMCQAISRDHEAWVVTRRNNRESIERELARNPNPHLHFCYADLPSWARRWKRGSRGIRLYYYLWQFAGLSTALAVMRTIRFDLAHHVTFTNSYVFTFAALLPVPFVWGPIGSNPPYPATLMSGAGDRLKASSRNALQALLRVADPLYWLCTWRARLIIGIDEDIAERFPISWLGKGKFVRHTAIGVESVGPPAPKRNSGTVVRIVAMGRMIRIKGFRLAICAFARAVGSCPQIELCVVGDGPDRPALERLVDDLGVRDRVTFAGWLPRDRALGQMEAADIFLFPSVEGAGMVVLEALARGVPVVCLAYGGPGEMVTPDTGIAVSIGEHEATADRLAQAICTLAGDAALRERTGAAGRRRVEQRYLWTARATAIAGWYSAALDSAGEAYGSSIRHEET
jgi:glycosyltransferase involved in cell wall biosynthesis